MTDKCCDLEAQPDSSIQAKSFTVIGHVMTGVSTP